MSSSQTARKRDVSLLRRQVYAVNLFFYSLILIIPSISPIRARYSRSANFAHQRIARRAARALASSLPPRGWCLARASSFCLVLRCRSSLSVPSSCGGGGAAVPSPAYRGDDRLVRAVRFGVELRLGCRASAPAPAWACRSTMAAGLPSSYSSRLSVAWSHGGRVVPLSLLLGSAFDRPSR